MTVKLDIDTTAAVRVRLARDRGLKAAGDVLLALSDTKVPRYDGEPRHGEHGVNTGFVRVEPQADRVAIGYTAFWLIWQHERMDYHHDNGEAKFLELSVIEGKEAALRAAAATMRRELGQ